MSSLYRKYRPQTFQEVVGQDHIKLALQYQLEKNNFAHAYLFCGPRGLGKTTMARLLAKAVNCEKRKEGEFEPCNKCDACQEITQGSSMDIIEIDAASHTGVDNVRENIIENVRFTPNKMKFKVFIIDEVHMLSVSAFNALLKTLEEPPEHAIFILCTTEVHKVPETIISRCQRFDFKKVGSQQMIARLKTICQQEKVKVEEKVLEVIAGRSGGCMRDAESLLGQILSLGSQKIDYQAVKSILPSSELRVILDLVELVADNQIQRSIAYLNQLVDDGIDLEVFGGELVELLRTLILIKLNVIQNKEGNWSAAEQKRVDKILSKLELGELALIIKQFMQASYESKSSYILQLPWELALIRIYEQRKLKNNKKDDEQDDDSKSNKSPGVLKEKINNIFTSKENEEQEDKKNKDKQAGVKKNKVDLNLDKIKENWGEIIRVSRQQNLDLMFISQDMLWPVEIKGNRLTVGFKYDLHKVRFEKKENINSFRQTIQQIIGDEVEVRAKTLKPSELAELEMANEKKQAESEELSGVKVTEENILDVVLQSFGGEIIEGGEG